MFETHESLHNLHLTSMWIYSVIACLFPVVVLYPHLKKIRYPKGRNCPPVSAYSSGHGRYLKCAHLSRLMMRIKQMSRQRRNESCWFKKMETEKLKARIMFCIGCLFTCFTIFLISRFKFHKNKIGPIL